MSGNKLRVGVKKLLHDTIIKVVTPVQGIAIHSDVLRMDTYILYR